MRSYYSSDDRPENGFRQQSGPDEGRDQQAIAQRQLLQFILELASPLPPISRSVKPSLLHYRYTRFVPATGQRNQAVFASETMIA